MVMIDTASSVDSAVTSTSRPLSRAMNRLYPRARGSQGQRISCFGCQGPQFLREGVIGLPGQDMSCEIRP
jgi:hypothetical protein